MCLSSPSQDEGVRSLSFVAAPVLLPAPVCLCVSAPERPSLREPETEPERARECMEKKRNKPERGSMTSVGSS